MWVKQQNKPKESGNIIFFLKEKLMIQKGERQ